MTLLAVFCWMRQRDVIDALTELMMDMIHHIGTRAERTTHRELIHDLKRITGKNTLLCQIAEASVEHPSGIVKEVIFPVVSKPTLRALIKELKATVPAYQTRVQMIMRRSYGSHYRRMVPAVLQALTFRSTNDTHQPLLRSLDLIKKYAGQSGRCFDADEDVPVEGVVRQEWQALVLERNRDGTHRVNRVPYEICVLQMLRDRLRCKEIWVVGDNRFRNPDEDVPQDFDRRRTSYYDNLHLPLEATTFIHQIQQDMEQALTILNDGLPSNPHVRILTNRRGWIELTPLSAQAESSNLVALKHELSARWMLTNLLDMLKETDLRLHFTECFKSATAQERLDRETLQRRLLLCLYGLGTNTGFKHMSAGNPDVDYTDLLSIRRRFLTCDQMRNGIVQVVNALFDLRMSDIWGEATTTCASDSKKFSA